VAPDDGQGIADYKIELIRETHRHLRFDIVFWGDDWGNQRNLFMRPDVWRAIIKPHTRRVFDAIHELGAMVNLHSCGRIESVFEDIVEIGADIWNPCQPCNDLAALKKRFGGRITFFGGIDSQFVLDAPDVTPQKVRAEVRKRIDDLSAGGGYIAAPSHSIPYRQDLLDAMRDEIATYGRQAYSRP
jgi:uroporphyrinogen-III decarboxylase